MLTPGLTVMPDLIVELWRGPKAIAPEWAWGQTLCESFLRQAVGEGALRVIERNVPRAVTVAEALAISEAGQIGIVLDDVSYWGEDSWRGLQAVLAAVPEVAAVGPVSNEATVAEQRAVPAFLYQTPYLLRLACRERRRAFRSQWKEVSDLDAFGFLVRRADLEALDSMTPLETVPRILASRGKKLAVAIDTYVHRYAEVYDQPRQDLQDLVPRDARRILDVGCARGAFGLALKQRQECHVTGLEVNPESAATASKRLDRVLESSVDRLAADTFGRDFDAIVCGDVLEHLYDPWSVVGKLASWLRPQGRILATVPNVGHWSIVLDLLEGRWDPIPFSLLCWSHLRFFTRSGVEQLFTGQGLWIEALTGLKPELPEIGVVFVERAGALVAAADREGLKIAEYLVVARKA